MVAADPSASLHFIPLSVTSFTVTLTTPPTADLYSRLSLSGKHKARETRMRSNSVYQPISRTFQRLLLQPPSSISSTCHAFMICMVHNCPTSQYSNWYGLQCYAMQLIFTERIHYNRYPNHIHGQVYLHDKIQEQP